MWHRIALTLICVSLPACGGKGAESAHSADVDADPFALLPPSAAAVARVDVRAALTDPSVGHELAALLDGLVPIGGESGFLASRDVGAAVIAFYATSTADAAAVLNWRFDLEKLSHPIAATDGAPINGVRHGRFMTYAAGPIEWSPLTSKVLIVGTHGGLALVLDRIEKDPLERALPPWAIDTLQTPGAQAALIADFSAQPVTSAAIGSIRLPWLTGMRVARVIGNLGSPGLNVAATLTYGNAGQAATAASGIRSMDRMLEVIGPALGGLKVQNFEVVSENSDVRGKFGVDTAGLRTLAALAPRLLPKLTP